MPDIKEFENQGILAVDVTTAAKWLGISRNTAYEMARTGKLPVIHCGMRRLKVPIASLRRMLAEPKSSQGSLRS